MIQVQKIHKEINRCVSLLRQLDLSTNRDKAIQVAEKLVKDTISLEQELKNKEGKFKALTKCLECREEDGLAYDVNVFTKQIIKCQYCSCNLSVRLYKNGRLSVSTMEQ